MTNTRQTTVVTGNAAHAVRRVGRERTERSREMITREIIVGDARDAPPRAQEDAAIEAQDILSRADEAAVIG